MADNEPFAESKRMRPYSLGNDNTRIELGPLQDARRVFEALQKLLCDLAVELKRTGYNLARFNLLVHPRTRYDVLLHAKYGGLMTVYQENRAKSNDFEMCGWKVSASSAVPDYEVWLRMDGETIRRIPFMPAQDKVRCEKVSY
jgi:hypothetical protein